MRPSTEVRSPAGDSLFTIRQALSKGESAIYRSTGALERLVLVRSELRDTGRRGDSQESIALLLRADVALCTGQSPPVPLSMRPLSRTRSDLDLNGLNRESSF